jgi:hypothetical protein
MSGLLHRWIGGLGILAGATTIIFGVEIAYVGCRSTYSGRCFDIYVIDLAGNFRCIHVEKVYDKDQRLTLETLKKYLIL